MTRLVLIGGAPGVGKSTVAREIFLRLDNCVWLDGDDLWRMNPFSVNEKSIRMVERNIDFVLRSFIEEGFAYVLFTWVLHLESTTRRLLASLSGSKFDLFHFTLVCGEQTLKARIMSDSSRSTDVELALDRLHKTRLLPSRQIDTDGKEPSIIARELIRAISEPQPIAPPGENDAGFSPIRPQFADSGCEALEDPEKDIWRRRIEHLAYWTRDLERLKDFFVRYFGAIPGPKYTNSAKGFASYFLSFDTGARIEIMASSHFTPATTDPESQRAGLAHLAIAVGSEQAVDELTCRLRADGYRVIDGPRRTGDGYYESVMLDPDGNRFEITV